MKKILAVLVAILAVIPVVANAAEYAAGDYINFFKNEGDKNAYGTDGDESVGMATIYVGGADKDVDGVKYLKSLAIGYHGSSTMCSTPACTDYDKVVVVNGVAMNVLTKNYDILSKNIEKPAGFYGDDGKLVVEIATLADLQAALKFTDTIDVSDEKIAGWLNGLTGGYKVGAGADSYIGTSTKVDGQNKFKAIKVTKDSAGKVTAAVVEEVNDTATVWAGTIVYMNETYTCKGGSTDEYLCYSCPTDSDKNKKEYVWKKKGEQAAECEVVTDKVRASDCITPPPTGVDNYLIPAAVVLGVCAIVLTVVKRKDAFRAI